MRTLIFFSLLLITQLAFSQDKKQIIKSWIKGATYSLPDNNKIYDTLYTRYTFEKNKVYTSFNPAWNDYPREWHMSGNKLTIGFINYDIETLTDSTLIITEAGATRIILLDEEYVKRNIPAPDAVRQLGGKPVYKATDYFTPRWKKEDLRSYISEKLGGYNIKRATTFVAEFVVKEDGTVDDIKIVHGITTGFDAEIIDKLKKTSKNWLPATLNGQPVQTLVTYTIKYLDSLVPY